MDSKRSVLSNFGTFPALWELLKQKKVASSKNSLNIPYKPEPFLREAPPKYDFSYIMPLINPPIASSGPVSPAAMPRRSKAHSPPESLLPTGAQARRQLDHSRR